VFFGIPETEFAWLVAAIVAGGVATGILAGLFGVGGGAIIVPVLYEVFRTFGVSDAVRMQLCVGTSLEIILPTSIRSFLAHRAKGDLPVEILRLWAAPIILGVAAGGGGCGCGARRGVQARLGGHLRVAGDKIPIRE
jgi:uncharacterized protein